MSPNPTQLLDEQIEVAREIAKADHQQQRQRLVNGVWRNEADAIESLIEAASRIEQVEDELARIKGLGAPLMAAERDQYARERDQAIADCRELYGLVEANRHAFPGGTVDGLLTRLSKYGEKP